MRIQFILVALLSLLSGCSGLDLLNGLTPDRHSRITSVAYGSLPRQDLDIYLPAGDVQDAPVVVFVYGGRWSFGEKSEYRFVGQSLANRGYVAVVPNYRLYPDVVFPAFVEDIALALRWVTDHLPEYGASTDKLFLMGHSAGAHTIAHLALNPAYLQQAGLSRTLIDGVIPMAVPIDFLPPKEDDLKEIFGGEQGYTQGEVIEQLGGGSPPMLLLHGGSDDTVWPINSTTLAEKLQAAGTPAHAKIYPGVSHGLILAGFTGAAGSLIGLLDDIDRFIAQYSPR